jgi:hypothetical protein
MAVEPSALNEIVLFELPTEADAERLEKHLAGQRLAWLQGGDIAAIVGVLLNPEDGDLAVLLRSVEAWLGSVGFAGIRFEVDGRTYVLEARQPSFL